MKKKGLTLLLISLATILTQIHAKATYHSTSSYTSYTNNNGDVHKTKIEKVNDNGKEHKYIEKKHLKNGKTLDYSLKGSKSKVKKHKKKLKMPKFKKLKFPKFEDFTSDFKALNLEMQRDIEKEEKRWHKLDDYGRHRRQRWGRIMDRFKRRFRKKMKRLRRKGKRGSKHRYSESFKEVYSNKNGEIKKNTIRKVDNDGKKKTVERVYHEKDGKVLKNEEKVNGNGLD